MPSFKLAAMFLAATALAVDSTRNPSLNAELETATQQIDRLALLPSDSDWLFDFTAQPSYTFSPGSVVNANAATFPAAVDNELTMVCAGCLPLCMMTGANTFCSGTYQPRTLCNVATSLAPTRQQLCHGHHRQRDDIYDRRKWCPQHQRGPLTWSHDHFPSWYEPLYYYSDEGLC